MKIILDSTVLCADFPLNGTAFSVLIEGLPRIAGQLCIPAVVVDELENKYREALRDLNRKASKLNRELARILLTPIDGAVTSIDDDGEAKRYRRFLLDFVHRVGGLVLPYPDVDHVKIVSRALMRRKPFKENGSGYRDALIWESLLHFANKTADPIYFVTHNKRDFGEGPRVHPDLSADLVALGVDPQRVVVLPSLEALSSQFILPQLERLDDMVNKMASGTLSAFSLEEWLMGDFIDVLNDQECGGHMLDVSGLNVSATVSKVKEVRSFDVDDIRVLSRDRLVVSVRARIVSEVCVSCNWDVLWSNSRIRDVFGDCDFRSSDIVWIDVNTRLSLDAIMNQRKMTVQSAKVCEVEGVGATYTLGQRS